MAHLSLTVTQRTPLPTPIYNKRKKKNISAQRALTCTQFGLQSSDCVNGGDTQCRELIGLLIPYSLVLLTHLRCSAWYFQQWTLTLLGFSKAKQLDIFLPVRPLNTAFQLDNCEGSLVLTSTNVRIAAKQQNNLLGFNGHSTPPFRVPLLIYFGCPVMWRTSGRGQVVSTAGMCPLSKLHGGCIYSTWPQDGSRDRLE